MHPSEKVVLEIKSRTNASHIAPTTEFNHRNASPIAPTTKSNHRNTSLLAQPPNPITAMPPPLPNHRIQSPQCIPFHVTIALNHAPPPSKYSPFTLQARHIQPTCTAD